jgi:hypothetical protein
LITALIRFDSYFGSQQQAQPRLVVVETALTAKLNPQNPFMHPVDVMVLPGEQCSSVSNDPAGWAELVYIVIDQKPSTGGVWPLSKRITYLFAPS